MKEIKVLTAKELHNEVKAMTYQEIKAAKGTLINRTVKEVEVLSGEIHRALLNNEYANNRYGYQNGILNATFKQRSLLLRKATIKLEKLYRIGFVVPYELQREIYDIHLNRGGYNV